MAGVDGFPIANGEATPDKARIKKVRGEAFTVIKNSLDIVTMVKEINNLRILTHLLLKDHHLKLVPAVALSLQLSKGNMKKGDPRESEGAGLSNYAQETKIDFPKAFQMVADKHTAQVASPFGSY